VQPWENLLRGGKRLCREVMDGVGQRRGADGVNGRVVDDFVEAVGGIRQGARLDQVSGGWWSW